jgi:hypothetical protein
MFKEIDFGNHVQDLILSNDLDENLSLENQFENLTEDLLQVHFNMSLILDIGWYPSFDPNGEFIIYLIQYDSWDDPIIKCTAKSISDLKGLIEKIIKLINYIVIN